MKQYSATWIFILVVSSAAIVARSDGPQPHPIHSTHKSDDSIDVSSSIGVSHDGGSDQSVAGSAGMVEDLLANESSMDNAATAIRPPIGPAGLSHAAVVDSESDLMGAESDSKFSFSKLKRPFARLPFDLRFNTRFLNGPLMSSGSNVMPQIHHPQPHPPMRPPTLMRQPPPPMPPRPFHNQINVPGHRGQYQPPPPPPGFGGHQPNPMYKGPMQGPPPPPPLPPQGPPQMQAAPKAMMQPQIQPQIQMMHNVHHSNGPQPHIDLSEGPQGPPMGGGGGGGVGGLHGGDPMVHSIAEYLETADDGRHNELMNDYDRQTLPAPSNDIWPIAQPDLAKIVHLDVKCEKNFMKVSVEFDRPFNGIIFSKGHFSQPNCIHLPAGSGRSSIYFDIRIDSCGTTGNMGPNSLSAYGNVNAGNFFENIVIFQYDAFVQEAWDQARKLRCTWHDQYEKSVSFRPFPVDMVDVVRADFAGDNVGCWMQIQVGRGPWASEVAGIVKIGQTMTMVLAIKDEENKFDMLVRNCVAHDGKRAPIELVDSNGCIVRTKLMSRFTKIKNFGSSASVLSYAHFQAFKFPDSMEVHFQCTIQICKNSCPEQCDQSGQSNIHYINHQISGTINTQSNHNNQQMGGGGMGGGMGGDTIFLSSDMANAAAQIGEPPQRSDNGVLARPREVRDVSSQDMMMPSNGTTNGDDENILVRQSKEVGVNKVIRVISTGDLSFATSDKLTAQQPGGNETTMHQNNNNGTQSGSGSSSATGAGNRARSWLSEKINEKICMSSINFLVCFVTLSTLALFFCTCSVVMCCRKRSTLDGATAAMAMLHGGHNLNGKLSGKKSSAKEQSLMNGKKHRGGGGGGKHEHAGDYGGSQTVIPVMANNGGQQQNGSNYLSSSSVLSPRVQAAGANGYTIYH